MFRIKKLKEENSLLKNRVNELEEKICPCQSHSWKKIDFDFSFGTGNGDCDLIHTYICEKCGKIVKTWKML